MTKFDFGDSRVLICAASTEEILIFQHSVAPAGAAWAGFILGLDPLTKLDGVDLIVVLAPRANPQVDALLRQIRSHYSLLEVPVFLVAGPSVDQVAEQIYYANDFILGRVTPLELTIRLSKLLQVRQKFLEAAALNLKLHRDLHDRSVKLQTLIDNGLLMSATRDVNQLFRHALWEGKRLLHCDASSLYLVTARKTLQFAMRTKSDTLPSNEILMVDPTTGAANEHYISVYAALHGQSVVIDDVYTETRFDLSGTKAFDQATAYKTVSVLTVPMVSRGGPVTGVFQFMNRTDPDTGAVVAFSQGCVPLVEALAAQAAVTYENLQLLEGCS